MNDLQRALENTQVEGWSGLEESRGYPEGLTKEGILKLLIEGEYIGRVLISADLVPDSATSLAIIERGGDLTDRYVVYSAFRNGIGSEQPG